MKKRFKLITTIASLCLAVALMAFGVYAAAITDLTVSGTVKFEASEIDGEWTELKIEVLGGTIGGAPSKTYTTEVTDGGTINLDEIKVTAANAACEITITATFRNDSNSKAAELTTSGVTEAVDAQAGQLYTLAVKNDNPTGSPVTVAADTIDTDATENTNTISVKFTFTALDAAQTTTSPIAVTFNADPAQA